MLMLGAGQGAPKHVNDSGVFIGKAMPALVAYHVMAIKAYVNS